MPVEFDPTVDVSGSFLLMQATETRTGSASTMGLGTNGSRGAVNPFNEQPAASADKSYSLALLTASRSQLANARYIVLYEPGYPAELLSLSECLKSLAPGYSESSSSATTQAISYLSPAEVNSTAPIAAPTGTQPAPIMMQMGASTGMTSSTRHK